MRLVLPGISSVCRKIYSVCEVFTTDCEELHSVITEVGVCVCMERFHVTQSTCPDAHTTLLFLSVHSQYMVPVSYEVDITTTHTCV